MRVIQIALKGMTCNDVGSIRLAQNSDKHEALVDSSWIRHTSAVFRRFRKIAKSYY